MAFSLTNSHNKLLFLLLATLLCLKNLYCQPFQRQLLPVNLASALACEDIDGDGFLELLAATPNQLVLLSYRPQGWQTLWTSPPDQTPASARAVFLLDLNRDGRSDILALDDATSDDRDTLSQHAIWLQNDTLNFTLLDPAWQGENPAPSAALAWREIDGALELFMGAQFGASHRFLQTTNAGPAPFAPAWQPSAGAHLASASWLDLDADQDLDLAAINFQGEDIFLRSFSALGPDSIINLSQVTGEQTVFTVGGAWADVNHDGLPDLFLPTYQGKPDLFFWNRGDLTFAADASLAFTATPSWSAAATWLDIDNDSDADLLLLDKFAAAKLYRNDGTGAFTLMPTEALGELGDADGFVSSMLKADFDGDGLLDIALANGAGPVAVFFNKNRVFGNPGRWHRRGWDYVPESLNAVS